MTTFKTTLGAVCFAAASLAATWNVSAPVLLPGAQGSFDEIAVKDPTVVRHKGKWHIFYTACGRNGLSIGYVAGSSWEELRTGPRAELKQLSGKAVAYAAAPQVFFFAPQRKWYLIYQTRDAYYQPVYSTTENIDDPRSWTPPAALLDKQDAAKWIDFWVICDRDKAYLFFTRSHKDVMVMTTSKSEFPRGFRDMQPVFQPVHEAVHVYRLRGEADPWIMLFETMDGRLRRFGLARSPSPAGPWKLVTPDFASGAQLKYPAEVQRWTDEVSHGELIRTGFDEYLEVDGSHLELLIQGLTAGRHKGDYAMLRWQLGLISMVGGIQ